MKLNISVLDHLSNHTGIPYNERKHITEQTLLYIVSIFYPLIFILGLCGNSLIVYTVYKYKEMQTVINILITNLAISDLIITFVAVPLTPLSYFLNSWSLGEAMCHITPVLVSAPVYVSTLTTTVIAIDRYRAVAYPFKPRLNKCTYGIIIGFIWFISICLTYPTGTITKYRKIKPNVFKCSESWKEREAGISYALFAFFSQYIFPLSIISYCYIKISKILNTRSKNLLGKATTDQIQAEIAKEQKIKCMLIAVVALFVICWLPFNIHLILIHFDFHSGFKLFFAFHMLAMLSCVYNAFLYYFMNEAFRTAFKKVFSTINCCKNFTHEHQIKS